MYPLYQATTVHEFKSVSKDPFGFTKKRELVIEYRISVYLHKSCKGYISRQTYKSATHSAEAAKRKNKSSV